MSVFLTRADFEYAAHQAGITDLEQIGEIYANPHTQAAYTVWKSVAFPFGERGEPPLAWVNRRGGKAVGIVLQRPTGSESPSWPKRRALGYEPAMPLYVNVPGVSPEVMAALNEHKRQREEEGYTVASDLAQYHDGELARGAACYAMQAGGMYPMRYASIWPFNSKQKVCKPVESLTKAAAMLFAELERLKALESPR